MKEQNKNTKWKKKEKEIHAGTGIQLEYGNPTP